MFSKKKIKNFPVSDYFDDISAQDGKDFDKCCAFFKAKYEKAFKGNRLFTYVTCTLDTDNSRKIFLAVRGTVVEEAIDDF